jgi:hypothetical protein
VIYGAPQVVRLPIDPDEHFIQMPLTMTSMLLPLPPSTLNHILSEMGMPPMIVNKREPL